MNDNASIVFSRVLTPSSWKPNGRDGHPLMLDENLKPKPAYLQQLEMLKSMAGGKK